MKKLLFLFCLLLLGTLRTPPSEAYVMIPGNNGGTVRWNLSSSSSLVQNGRVVYSLNPAGSDDVPFNQVESAVAASFQAWENVPDSTIAFTRGANTTARGTRADNVFQLYWSESSTDADYVNFTGAVAVTYVTYMNAGDLIDASMIFNGVEYSWAADGRGDRLDIAEVASHEIGHALGIAHSSVGGATMFPRTGVGATNSRTLSSDDAVAVSVLYPVADFAARTGSLRGTVRDNGGATIFGANVVASDANGNVVATALSQPDGSYRIAGLPPGGYSVFAEPIDEDQGITFYGKGDLNSFYDAVVTNFLTTNDQTATVRANAETGLDFTVTRGTPAFNPFLVFVAGSQGRLLNVATSLSAGTTTTVGLGGSGLPTSGTPLTISGSGITVNQTRFGSYSGSAGSGQIVTLDITVAVNAAPGARTLFVSNGSQRAAIVGAVEIIGTGAPAPPTLTTVSAANYTQTVARESIAAVFGTTLASGEAKGRTNPLPTELNGVRVLVRDAGGTERAAPLFYVSPAQINYQIPPGSSDGTALINFFNNGAPTGRSTLNLENVAPGLFTYAGTGRGAVAGLLLRVRANGQQVYENLATYVAATAQWQTLPLDWNNATDQLFLVLFGTGIRFQSSLNTVIATIGGTRHNVLYAGAQGSLVGVDQVNIQLNRANVVGRGEVDVVLTIENKFSNAVKVNFR